MAMQPHDDENGAGDEGWDCERCHYWDGLDVDIRLPNASSALVRPAQLTMER